METCSPQTKISLLVYTIPKQQHNCNILPDNYPPNICRNNLQRYPNPMSMLCTLTSAQAPLYSEEQGRLKVLACIQDSPCPLHGKAGHAGIEEAAVVYRELERLKNPEKHPAMVAGESSSSSHAQMQVDVEAADVAMELEPGEVETCPVTAKARTLAMEDMSCIFKHTSIHGLCDDVKFRVGSGEGFSVSKTCQDTYLDI